MPSCAILSCRKRSNCHTKTKGGVSFHRFPKDPKLRKIWMDATGREDWISTKSSCICSLHFTEDDYAVKKSGYKYLREGAIPHENIIRIHSLRSLHESCQTPKATHKI
ncbi:hypothetical protein ABMA28_014090 [Loxostege sticticalis]|uniref:THAP-type domain-containing protein n=1 Tax=Loxostege sticticalis TaxID=481309 RepID=A0ABD0TFI1_LOXSC